MSCQTSIELLPWLLNGSLEEPQRSGLVAHLADCEACRGELAEMVELWQIFDVHVPARDLAAYSQGLPPAEWSRQDLERHLAVCAPCRRELEDAQSVLGAGRRRVEPARPAAPAIWRPALKWAAAVVVAVLLGFWFGRLDRDLAGPGGEALQPGTVAASLRDAVPTAPAEVLHADDFESGTAARWIVVSPQSPQGLDQDSS